MFWVQLLLPKKKKKKVCGALNWSKVGLPENTPKSTLLLPLSDVAKAFHFLSGELPMEAITLEL